MKTQDTAESNVAKIATLFPQCVTERIGKSGTAELAIDFDKLRDELSKDLLDGAEERYQFTWPDKRAASRLANAETDKTLRPDINASEDFWNTENLYIEGDNLDVLKVLRENYLGAIKMIYIDPPYNTGNDFVYNDDFAQSREDFEATSGAFDEDGNQLIDPMQRNTESNGRFHTDWLNMIYPRLKVARDLLADDGVIFISIGDTELCNLQKICNEIFGDQNFIAKLTIITGANQAGEGVLIQKNVEYVLVYGKDILVSEINRVDKTEESWRNLNDAPTPLITRPDMGYTLYYNPITKDIIPVMDYDKSMLHSNDENLIYHNEANLIANGYIPVRPGKRNGSLHRWRWGYDTFIQRKAEVEIFKGRDGYTPKFLQTGFNPPKNYHHFSGGASELKSLFGEKTPFDYPKGLPLIQYLASIGSKADSTILDFFSGSATTAHAVMKLNAEDGGKRKFIMVQLPEVTDEKSEARKAGYETICQIGEERIRRAGKKILEEVRSEKLGVRSDKARNLFGQEDSSQLTSNSSLKDNSSLPDVGFRVLKLDSSNMEDVFYTPEDFDAQNIFTTVDNVKPDRTPLDLLFQVLPELDIELSAKIEEKEVNGKKVFFVDGNYLIATFDTEVNESTVTEIAKMKPQYFVMRDASAANDNVLDNFEQIFRHYSPDTIRKIL